MQDDVLVCCRNAVLKVFEEKGNVRRVDYVQESIRVWVCISNPGKKLFRARSECMWIGCMRSVYDEQVFTEQQSRALREIPSTDWNIGLATVVIYTTTRRLGYQDGHDCGHGNECQDPGDDDDFPVILAHIRPACTLGPRELLGSTIPLLCGTAWVWVDAALASGQDTAGCALGCHGCNAHLEISGGDVDT